jgi:hypothetical protein
MEQVLCACDGVAAAKLIDASAATVAINLIGLIVLNITILLFPSLCSCPKSSLSLARVRHLTHLHGAILWQTTFI